MMKRLKNFKELGQTSIEYLLMLVVAATIAMTFFKKFEAYFISDPNSYVGGQLRMIENMLNNGDPSQPFKRFQLIK